jgi:hypothetical protein
MLTLLLEDKTYGGHSYFRGTERIRFRRPYTNNILSAHQTAEKQREFNI